MINKFKFNFKLMMLFFVIAGLPAISLATVPSDFALSATVEKTYDLSSPSKIQIWNKSYSMPTPNGKQNALSFFLVCMSDSNTDYGACPVKPSWSGLGSFVSLSFVEERSHIKHDAIISGEMQTACGGTKRFTGTPGGCRGNGLTYNVYITQNELKKFPIGGIWRAHLKLQTGQWHGGTGCINNIIGCRMSAYWTADITLKVTDDKNIKIWLPQFHGSAASVVMPLSPAYWPSNQHRQVTAEKTVEACLYDGYNSNSQTFQVTFTSNSIDANSRNFILKNTTTPGSSSLPYQVFVSSPGSSGALKMVKPGEPLVYSGMNTKAIRQVMMPGLQEPVACVPWPIKLKLKPFDLSQQPAGHYTGILNLTFNPSLAQ